MIKWLIPLKKLKDKSMFLEMAIMYLRKSENNRESTIKKLKRRFILSIITKIKSNKFNKMKNTSNITVKSMFLETASTCSINLRISINKLQNIKNSFNMRTMSSKSNVLSPNYMTITNTKINSSYYIKNKIIMKSSIISKYTLNKKLSIMITKI